MWYLNPITSLTQAIQSVWTHCEKIGVNITLDLQTAKHTKYYFFSKRTDDTEFPTIVFYHKNECIFSLFIKNAFKFNLSLCSFKFKVTNFKPVFEFHMWLIHGCVKNGWINPCQKVVYKKSEIAQVVEQVLWKFFYRGSWVQILVREGFTLIEKNNYMGNKSPYCEWYDIYVYLFLQHTEHEMPKFGF